MDSRSNKDFIIKADDEQLILLEHQLIDNMVSIREEQGLSQAELAKICNIKQPVIARMEKATHSPQIDSLLKVLVPMGYTLQIVPLHKNE